MPRRSAPVPRMVDLEALLLRDYELHERRSAARAEAAFRHLIEHMKTLRPARAYEATMRYVIARRAERAAPATIRYEVSVLGRALTIAARMGRIAARPMLARPAVRNARRNFISAEGLLRLLAALPEPIRDATLFAFVTGWRRSEVFGLRWAKVDLVDGVVYLDPKASKNGEGRSWPYRPHGKLRRMLERRALHARSEWVFCWDHGGRIVTFDRTWKRACREAGLGHTVFHDLKRSAVRNMERARVPRTVAMALIGHKTESIYRRYGITDQEDHERGVRLLARLSQKERRGPGAVEAQAQEAEP